MAQIWKKWCRLCGRDNSNIDVFIKDETFSSLAEAIHKFLSIVVNNYDEAPTKICKMCHQLIHDIMNFYIRATKVQEMYFELQFSDKFEVINMDVDELRLKYGLQEEKYSPNKSEEDDPEDDSDSFIKRKRRRKSSLLEQHLEDQAINEVQNNDEENDFNDNGLPIEDNISYFQYEGEQNFNDSEMSKTDLNITDDSSVKDENHEARLLQNKKRRPYKKREKKNIIKNDELIEDIIDEEKEPVAECDLCNKKFYNKGGYTFHLKSKHAVINDPIPCKFCGKLFKAISDHQKHESTHLPPEERRAFPCEQCDKKFFSEGNLNAHVKVVHIREKSFICEECGKSYVTVDALNSHKVVHTEEKPFKCVKCPKAFKRLPTLKLHIESHDNNKYICSICGTQLNSRALLRRHMVVHSDEKKYKCNFCEKEFKRPDAFKHHLILHTGLKPYECPFCELTFANGSNCRKHQKTSHPVELAAAEAVGVKRVCRNVPKIDQLRAVNNGAITETIRDLTISEEIQDILLPEVIPEVSVPELITYPIKDGN